jgi:outer membrane receptor protein involved in Fe transport
MRKNENPTTVYRRLACLAVLLTTTFASAQVTPTEEPKPESPKPTPTSEAKAIEPAKEPKIPSKEEVTAAATKGDQATVAEDGETLILSPFEVSSGKDRGYRGASSMSGTRMGSDLDDIANPMTVVTKQQLLDMAARDINDIFASEVSVEGTRTYTANFNDGKQDVDSVSLNPETANRVRGLGAANISVGNFGKSSTIPIDVYNVDAVEISRGPNSSIFGMGEASGTVNLVPSAANITQDLSKVSLSYSSYGTARGSLDFNRVLWKNKFALRVNALQNNQGFLRDPSYDKTRRYQFSGTYKPFKYTTIRASYENFNEKYSRPNSVTPRELVSLWGEAGRPSWNPSNNTWSYDAHTDPHTGLYYNAATGLVTPPSSTSNTSYFPYNATNAVWLMGYGSTRVRPVMFIDQGQVQWAGNTSWGAPVGAPAAQVRHEIVTFGTPVNYNVPFQFQGTLPYSAIRATRDKAFYDYESLNLAGLNSGVKEAETTRVELEQFIINTPTHVLAAQLGFFKELIEDGRRTFVGNGGDGVPLYIYPDVNTTYPDGTPNPYYGAPYITALAPQTYVNPVDTKTFRGNLVYQLDLTKQKGWLHHLGKAKILGYGESFEKISAPKNLRYQDQITDVYSPWYTYSIRNNNNGKFLTRYYLGDSNGGNVDYGSQAPATYNKINLNRWGSVAGEPTMNNWYKIDNVNVAPAWFSQGKQQMETTTRGFILQNYLVKDRLITTWGKRRDTLRTRDSGAEPSWAIDPVTGLSTTLEWMNDFGASPWLVTNKKTLATESVGDTENFGIVVKPFRWLHLRYNQSTSFKPEEFGIDFQGDPLANSSGESKDYGVVFNLFKDKLRIEISHFETFATASRANDINTVAQRITNLDYDINPATNGSGFDLEDWLVNELAARDGVIAPITPTPEQTSAWLIEAHQLMKLSEQRIQDNRTYTRAMTSDKEAKGYEVSIDYNPNAFLSLKFNGSQGETIYTNMGRTWQDYRDERMPLWTTIASPNPASINPATGARYTWWTDPRYSSTPQTNWIGLNEAPMKVNLALQGKPVPQQAKYRFNVLGRYRLAGMFRSTPFLKDTAVGGKLSWIDESGIGFYGAAPEADGKVREYDANNPIMYKAQTYVDLFCTYDFRMFSNRIRGNVQLNVKNVAENGRLQPFGVNPDGSYYNYRIIDPREFILSVNFDL